jgi:hypothetical protein
MLQDRITLIYTDTPYGFSENVEIIIIENYCDKLRDAASRALQEGAILVAVFSLNHSI